MQPIQLSSNNVSLNIIKSMELMEQSGRLNLIKNELEYSEILNEFQFSFPILLFLIISMSFFESSFQSFLNNRQPTNEYKYI